MNISGNNIISLSDRRAMRGPLGFQKREWSDLDHSIATSWGTITVRGYLSLRKLPLETAKSLKICELLQDIPYEMEYSNKLDPLMKKAVVNKAAVFRRQLIGHLKGKCGFEDTPDDVLDHIIDPTTAKLRRLLGEKNIEGERPLFSGKLDAMDKSEILSVVTEHLIIKAGDCTANNYPGRKQSAHITIELKRKTDYPWLNEPVHVLSQEMPIMIRWINLNSALALLY